VIMKTELVSEHTVAVLPKYSSMVLDVGCRHFDFSLAMASRGYKVIAIEADKDVEAVENIDFGNYALVPESQNGTLQTLIKFGNGSANHLLVVGGAIPKDGTVDHVEGLSLTEIGRKFGVEHWDVVKLDCEGAEYQVLLEWPGPIAEQIAVEFHEHTGANAHGESIYDAIIKHLSQWYEVVQHEKSVRHCLSIPNYWDSVFALKKPRAMNYEYAGQKLWYHATIIKHLERLGKLLRDNGIKFWLDGGTLLGAVRNGKMVPWDYDADISVYHDDVEKIESLTPLIEAEGYGFRAERDEKYTKIIRFFTKGKYEFHVDIYPWVIDGDSVFACAKPGFIQPVGWYAELGEIEFEGTMYPYWKPAEPFLAQAYRGDWRTPKILSGNVTYIANTCPITRILRKRLLNTD